MAWPDTPIAALLRCRLPIVQAGMAGGITPPELVAAVCEAEAFGTIGAGTLSPGALRDAIAAIRARTDRPFGVNPGRTCCRFTAQPLRPMASCRSLPISGRPSLSPARP